MDLLQDRVSYSSLDALSKTIECEPFNKPEVGMYFTILYIILFYNSFSLNKMYLKLNRN